MTHVPPDPARMTRGRRPVHYLDLGRPAATPRGTTTPCPGPSVVLVHGAASGADLWRPVARALADGHRVLAPYLPGAGATWDDGGPLSVTALSEQVAATIEDAGAGPVHLCGHSLGAGVAAHLAAVRPDLVRSLALVCGWVRTDAQGDGVLDRWSQALRDLPSGLARLLVATGLGPAHRERLGPGGALDLVRLVRDQMPVGAARQIAAARTLDLRAVLPAVRAPTLVVGCTHDQLVPVRHQHELVHVVQDARYLEVDAGHLVVIERPGLLGRSLTTFWSGLP